jgi:hypothetical protein
MVSISFVSLDLFKKMLGMKDCEWKERPDFWRLGLASALTGLPSTLITAP